MNKHIAIIKLYEEGATITLIAETLFYSFNHVYNVLRLYNIIQPKRSKNGHIRKIC